MKHTYTFEVAVTMLRCESGYPLLDEAKLDEIATEIRYHLENCWPCSVKVDSDPCANHNHIDADSTARCQDNDGEADDYHGEAT